MSSADRMELLAYWLRTGPRRYSFALVSISGAALASYSLVVAMGITSPLILFYPTIFMVGVLAGFGPALFGTILSVAISAFLFTAPLYSFKVSSPRDNFTLLLFTSLGAALSWLANSTRLRSAKLQEFERAVDGLDEMIAVVDSNYRYLIANDAFLAYREMERPDVIGKKVSEILNPGVFESEVKPKLDDCFKGNVVRFEMNYHYSKRGMRELMLSYFPIGARGTVDRVACVLQDVTELRQADRAARLFRTLIDHTNDAVAVVDPETMRFIDVNDKACHALGYTRAELLSMRVSDIDPSLDEASRANTAEKLLAGEPVLRVSFNRRKDGSTFPVETSLNHVQLERSYVIAVSRDLSAREKMAQALERSEEHFRQLVEQSSDGIFIADAQGKYTDVNTAGAEMLGYTREEVIGKCIADVVVKKEVGRIEPEIAKYAGGVTTLRDWIFQRKDGSFFPGEVCGKQLPDGRLQGIVRDMTERKRVEEHMRHSDERFRVALKDSPITVFNQDCDLRYTWIYNPQLYWQHDLVGKTDEEILGKKQTTAMTDLKHRVLRRGVPVREEVAISSDGKNYAVDMSLEPLFDEEGKVVGLTGAYMDIASLRELADRLQDSKDRLAQEKSYLENTIQTELGFERIIGQSECLRAVVRKARIVAPTDSTVLLLGETGTGKELMARSIHGLSSRQHNTFVKLNCAAVPSGLLESELFGHEKGAFTGAVSQKVGRVELADKGTLFLDEIGELPPELQPKLLRVLQDREFERLGGVKTLKVDVRIIAATNRDLRQDIADKVFREDLFYRLNVFPIEMPSLRERRDDIPRLVYHFMAKHSARMGKEISSVPDESMQILRNWNWPGNIRELENMIERMVIMTKGRTLAAPPAEVEAGLGSGIVDDNLIDIEREHIVRVLRESRGVLSGMDGAARRLGLKRTTLQSMLKRFGIEAQDFRRGSASFRS